MTERFDAIVVGGGHNGLVTATYLQKAGLRTLVLEARSLVGGSCVTEEVFPGFKVSTTSYVCSLLRPKIVEDLELERHGLQFIERDPSSFTPYPDGRHLMLWGERARTLQEIAKFSAHDADAYPRYEDTLARVGALVETLLLTTPPDPLSSRLSDLWSLASVGFKARGLGEDLYEQVRVLTLSAADFLDRWFESDELKSTLATDGVIGAYASPSHPGTAYVLMHHVMGETFGRKGVWAYVRGGMGSITQSMAKSFLASGGEVRTNTRVVQVLVRDGAVFGVVLKNGDVIHAPRIVSNADPRRTFALVEQVHLPAQFRENLPKIRYRSAAFKLNLALGGVPDFSSCRTVDVRPGSQHHGTMHICPSMEFIERAYLDARAGQPSQSPVLECTLPSALDETLCPKGKHVMGVFAQYAPYDIAGGWTEDAKNRFADRCIALIDEYAPGFKNLVEGCHLLSPVDLEREYGLTGGNIFHGEMSLDQMFFMRPIPELARHRTPIRQLYMCGAGTHPGGGVMGAAGHNAAREILKDARG